MTSTLSFRPVHTSSDAQELVHVLDEVWGGWTGAAGVQESMVIALAHAGNYTELAERDGKPVGAALGFFGQPLGQVLHSHIVGVTPGAAGYGVGEEMKRRQKSWCLERSITTITWTFDPLISRNAYFNIAKLGAMPTDYLVDFYGELPDGRNAGQATDRMLISWNLAEESSRSPKPLKPLRSVLRADKHGAPAVDTLPRDCRHVTLQVPRDIEQIRREDPALSHLWRTALRDSMLGLLRAGWKITGFDKSGFYIMERQ